MTLIKYDKSITEKFPELYDNIQDSYLKRTIYYIIHSKYRKIVNLRKWIDTFVKTDQKGAFNSILDVIPSNTNDYDLQVLNCLKWVVNNIIYVGDYKSWDSDEYFQTPLETISRKTGDCEDGAILLYYLCRMKGVPANRMLLLAGPVTGGRHCWLAYKPTEYPLNHTFLDWCYYVKFTNINLREKFYIDKFNKIHAYTYEGVPKTTDYLSVEFAFNENTSIESFKYDNTYRN